MASLNAMLISCALSGAGDVVLLEFSSDRCQYCRQMESIVRRLVSEDYPIRKINVEHEKNLAQQFHITGVPSYVMLVDGREASRIEGAAAFGELRQMYSDVGFKPTSGGKFTQRNDASDPAWIEQGSEDQQAGQGGLDARQPFRKDNSSLGILNRPRRISPPSEEKNVHGMAQRLSDARDRALQSSVRIRVEDAAGYSHGTGTLIDARYGNALILTCGHIFRESQGQGTIQVELFSHGTVQHTVTGSLLSYDADVADLGLIVIQPDFPVIVAEVAGRGARPAIDNQVFSIGCDHGQPPSIRESQITAINKYLGSPNIEVAGQPVDGRSGGGLFSATGQLIGVCNAADPEENEGIYAALMSIQETLAKNNLRFVFEPKVAQFAAPHADPKSREHALTDRTQIRSASLRNEPSRETLEIAELETPLSSQQVDEIAVICIVKSKVAGQQQRVVMLDRPSGQLIQQIARESNDETIRSIAAQGRDNPLQKQGLGKRVPRLAEIPPPNGPVVRAQSADH